MERDLKAEYESNVGQLYEMVSDQRQHMKETPNCSASPMCISPVQIIALGTAASMHPTYPMSLLMTAVGELRRLEDRVADLDNRLAAAQAELTSWEDAADVIGPVCLPGDPS